MGGGYSSRNLSGAIRIQEIKRLSGFLNGSFFSDNVLGPAFVFEEKLSKVFSQNTHYYKLDTADEKNATRG